LQVLNEASIYTWSVSVEASWYIYFQDMLAPVNSIYDCCYDVEKDWSLKNHIVQPHLSYTRLKYWIAEGKIYEGSKQIGPIDLNLCWIFWQKKLFMSIQWAILQVTYLQSPNNNTITKRTKSMLVTNMNIIHVHFCKNKQTWKTP